MSDGNSNISPVLIIGAGLSGPAAAHALKQRGIEARIVEKANAIAVPWRGRHPQLRVNTHRVHSSLPGLPMPKDAGPFPGRERVIRYLEDYAKFVRVPIEFGVTVTRLQPVRRGWSIETNAGHYSAEHVVVATGHDRIAWMPDWEGRDTFQGELIHSAAFGKLDQYRGKRVLVVGAGNSGSDILNHLSRIETKQLLVSVRHGPVVFPTWLLGVPVHFLAPVFEMLPIPLVDRMLGLTERLAFGDLSRWGMRKHAAGGATRLLQSGIAPAVDDGFVDALKAGRIAVVPEITGFDGAHVRLANGETVEPDVVIAATGYRTGLESMIGHLGVLDAEGAPTTNAGQQASTCPGLWFTGMRSHLGGYFREAAKAGEAIANEIERSGAVGDVRHMPNSAQVERLETAA
jgi:cation diffusion facilitator CzcD-associated flavoprotein CzcO